MSTSTRSEAPVRVALVEDDNSASARLCRAIEANPALQLICAATTGAEILARLPSHEADVLMVDLGLPDVSGLDVIGLCRELRPACEVMVISMFGDEADILRAIENGARAFPYTKTAQRLGIGHSTVHTHVNGTYRKLDVHNKAEAVFEARQQGWLA